VFGKKDAVILKCSLFVLAYPAMSLWLNKTGRPILFSCSWPAYQEGHMKVSRMRQMSTIIDYLLFPNHGVCQMYFCFYVRTNGDKVDNMKRRTCS